MSKFPQNQTPSIEKRARNVEEAIEAALSELGIEREDAEVEIISEASKGFLGLGAKEAVVKVTAKNAAAVPAEQAQAVETVLSESDEEQAPAAAKAVAPVANKSYDSDKPEENAKNFISDILGAMGLEVNVSAVLEGDVVNINLEGENMGIVIGKRGDTLDSIQYLTSLVVNQSSEDYIKISIDTENYRQKRSDALIALSNRLAQKVAKSGKKFALEPMNPYERRIIHANLQENEEVTTFSVGKEPYRKVIIAPKFQKSFKKGGYRGKNDRRRPQGGRGGYNRQGYNRGEKPTSSQAGSATYKADFKPQQHKAEYKNFEEYLAAISKK